jgi:hypothetical protein
VWCGVVFPTALVPSRWSAAQCDVRIKYPERKM